MFIGEQIKQRRKQLGMTQDELARKLKVSGSTVSNWEINRNFPDYKCLHSLSTILSIPLNTLLEEEGNVVKNIVANKQERNRIFDRIKTISITLFVLFTLIIYFCFFSKRDISRPEQILSAQKRLVNM